jgi:hypothetical protein
VLEIQKRKRLVIAAAFNEKKAKEAKETRWADLSLLLSGRRPTTGSGAGAVGA